MNTRLLMLFAGVALLSAAQAQTPSAPPPNNAAIISGAAPPNAADRSRPCADSPTVTGSRLPRTVASGCGDPAKDNPALRTYDRDQIDRTGATNTGDALRQLDPSASVSRP